MIVICRSKKSNNTLSPHDYNEITKSTDNVWSLMIISRKITNKPLFWLSIHHTIVMRTALDTCTIIIILSSNFSQQGVNLKNTCSAQWIYSCFSFLLLLRDDDETWFRITSILRTLGRFTLKYTLLTDSLVS